MDSNTGVQQTVCQTEQMLVLHLARTSPRPDGSSNLFSVLRGWLGSARSSCVFFLIDSGIINSCQSAEQKLKGYKWFSENESKTFSHEEEDATRKLPTVSHKNQDFWGPISRREHRKQDQEVLLVDHLSFLTTWFQFYFCYLVIFIVVLERCSLILRVPPHPAAQQFWRTSPRAAQFFYRLLLHLWY